MGLKRVSGGGNVAIFAGNAKEADVREQFFDEYGVHVEEVACFAFDFLDADELISWVKTGNFV